MSDNEPLDWEDLRIGYNRMYHTAYTTPPAMVAGLYQERLTLQKVGDILGVSREAVGKYMQKWGIPRYPKGHRGHSLFQDIYCKIKNPKKYTSKELAGMIGCSVSYIYNLKVKYRK